MKEVAARVQALTGAVFDDTRARKGPHRCITEQVLQRAVMAYLDAVLPPNAWSFHPPNGGKRGAIEGAMFEAMGTRAGLPDMGILFDGRCFWIELKAAAGRLSDETLAHSRLWEAGCPVVICRSIDEVRAALLGWAMPIRDARAAWHENRLAQLHASRTMVARRSARQDRRLPPRPMPG